MTDLSLALQAAVRGRLTGNAAVTAQVSAAHIFDRARRPEAFPCIVIGEGQTVNEGITLAREFARCYLDLHIWTKGEALADVKAITGPLEAALAGFPRTIEGGNVVDFQVAHTRFMRDPGGELQHGVTTVEALIQRAPQ